MIKIAELLREDLIILNLKSKDKKKVIQELVDAVVKVENVKDRADFLRTIMEREELESTGIGMGVAIPHCRTDAVNKIVIAFGRSVAGIDFESIDGKPAHLIFLIAAPEEEREQYIKVLAHLSRLLRREEFRRALMEAITRGEVIHLFTENEK